LTAIPPYERSRLGRQRAEEDFASPGQRRSKFQSDLLGHVYEPVRDALKRVDENLEQLRRDQIPFLAELLDHVLDNTGKQVRPALTLLASNFHPNDGYHAQLMATAVEVLHIASLLHDDTVDNSDYRRGKITVSSRWGLSKAILLGDFLLATSTTFICKTGNMRVIRRFSEVAVELSVGELHEMAESYSAQQTREKYLQRIYRKTASLFCAAGESGAVLSGAPEQITHALKEYGYNVGMAFQIVDDILDFDGSREEIGKPVGNDLAQGIVTLPAIIAIERYPQDNPIFTLFLKPEEEKALARQVDQDSLRRAIELIQEPSIIEESYAVADQYCRKALEDLASLEPNPSRHSLEELVYYLGRRRS